MNKLITKLTSVILPNLVVNIAYKILTSPQIKRLRDYELKILDIANKDVFEFKNYKIQIYKWQGGQNKVLLIHGWEGQAGNFADIIECLMKKNYTVYAFDGPSHGFSTKGETSLFEFSELVAVMIKKFEVSKLVSHSFGGVATTYSLNKNLDIEIQKYVLLTTPDKFSERIDNVAEQVGISKRVKNKLIAKLEKEAGVNVKTINVSDFVKKVNVKQALIVHDKNDKVVPIRQSRNVKENWNNCILEEVENTGHFRILRDKDVIDRVIEFLD